MDGIRFSAYQVLLLKNAINNYQIMTSVGCSLQNINFLILLEAVAQNAPRISVS